jgi:hypothetical protein
MSRDALRGGRSVMYKDKRRLLRPRGRGALAAIDVTELSVATQHENNR